MVAIYTLFPSQLYRMNAIFRTQDPVLESRGRRRRNGQCTIQFIRGSCVRDRVPLFYSRVSTPSDNFSHGSLASIETLPFLLICYTKELAEGSNSCCSCSRIRAHTSSKPRMVRPPFMLGLSAPDKSPSVHTLKRPQDSCHDNQGILEYVFAVSWPQSCNRYKVPTDHVYAQA